MIKYFVFFLSNLFFFVTQAQIKGVIKNGNNENVPYVNMAVLHANYGTCSDDNGYFELNIDNYLDDTLKLSSIGYESLLVPVRNLTNSCTLLLKEKPYMLRELVIRPEKLTNKYTLGFVKKPKKSSKTIPSVGIQIASYIQNTIRKTGYIQTVIVNFEKSSEYKTVDVRVRILECTDSLTPGKDLLQDNLIINPKNGRNKIDVSKYNILFPLNGIFVAIDIIDSKNVTKGKWMNVNPAIKITFDFPYSHTWLNYRDKNWSVEKYPNGLVGNARFGLEILSSE